MRYEEIRKLDEAYYMNTFGARTPVAFSEGKGIHLYTEEGECYTDFMAGIAVTALGHSHPKFVSRLKEQVGKLLHTSSLYYIENQARLAEKIVKCSAADRVFFANSGAEANEGAIKLAKIYHYKKSNPEKSEIITLVNSFHGRTLATVAATGQEKYQKPYRPLTPGFSHVPLGDFDALTSAVTDNTAAIMLELVQGESGVHPAEIEYIKAIRKLCDDKEILFIVDEVQTGMGRTGKLFAYEHYGIEPDIFTLAKALGGGVPIGAVCAKQFVADAFSPGDHGTTFGGNPLATCAGCAVFDILEEEKLVENSAEVGAYMKEKLSALSTEFPVISEVRGMGLMIGVEFSEPIAKDVQAKLLEKKYLVGAVGTTVLRLVPPLVLSKNDVDEFITVLKECLI
ncbi:MAG: aspartate aminotransferase family protein [Clostridia bacterium]|nr:aspartate aminotransferase family protein [Clostridia bacterium]